MVSTKRVILADGSRLLREMLHRALDRTDHLEVVQEMPDSNGLSAALERFDPEWVIVTQAYSRRSHGRIDSCMEAYPMVRFIFLSPHQNRIKMKWQASCEEEYSNLSLKEFIHILENSRQPT